MAALYHVYTQTVADGTATSVVRPSDWNSAHFQQQTIAGNTAGRSTWSGTNLVLQGGNNVTLSINTNSTASTLIISAASQSAQTGSIIQAARILGNTSGATASISSGTMVLAGGNNVTLSQNANSITISAGNPGIQRISFSGNTAGLSPLLEGATVTFNVTNGLTVSGISGSSVSLLGQNLGFGTNTNANSTNFTATSLSYVQTGPVRFAGQGGVTVSQPSLSVIQFSAPNALSVAIGGNTSGTLATLTDSVTFVGGNNITLSQNNNAITISAGGITASGFNPYDRLEMQASSIGNSTVNFDPILLPTAVGFNRFAIPILVTANATITNTFSLSYHVGIYTRTGDTLSLLLSTSASVGMGLPTLASIYTGVRRFTASVGNTTLTQGQYWIGNMSATASSVAGAGSVWNMILSQVASNYAGVIGQTTNATEQMTVGRGIYSAVSAALPTSVALSQIQGTGSQIFRPQPIMFANE